MSDPQVIGRLDGKEEAFRSEIVSTVLIWKMVPFSKDREVSNLYYDQANWNPDRTLINADKLHTLFEWEESKRRLNVEEFKQFWNNYIVPLWNLIYTGKNNKNVIVDTEELITNKGDLIDVVWLLSKAFELKELETGITFSRAR